jgi:hypothetical protein
MPISNHLLDYVLSSFKGGFGDAILSGRVRYLPSEAFIDIAVATPSKSLIAHARALESEFEELGRSVHIAVRARPV